MNINVRSQWGDPQWYTKKFLAQPPLDDRWLEIYEAKFDIDPTNSEELTELFRKEKYIEFMCEFDFCLFIENILEMIVKPFHVEWSYELANNDRLVLLAPRDHGKTQFFSRNYVLWKCYYKKVDEIYIISSTIERASDMMNGHDSIKEQIELNEKLSHLKPKASEGKWADRKVQLSNGVRLFISGFPPKRGPHPGLIVLDDVLIDENCLTDMLRDKTHRQYSAIVEPMAPKSAQIVAVGTALHPQDLLHRLGEGKMFEFRVYQAVNEMTMEVLWPERRSYDWLQDYRHDYGELMYMREYQNKPMSDNLSYFPERIITSCFNEKISYVHRYMGENPVFFGGDLSPPGGAKRGGGDYTVFCVLERLPTGKLRLLNYMMFRDDPLSKENFMNHQLSEIKRMAQNFRVSFGYIEEVGFSSVYTKDFIQRGTNLPIEGKTVSATGKRSLNSGIPYLRSLMEKGNFEFPYYSDRDKEMTNELLKQFKGIVSDDRTGKFGNQGYHDDIPVSLWMAVEASKKLAVPIRMSDLPRGRGWKGPKRGFYRRKK